MTDAGPRAQRVETRVHLLQAMAMRDERCDRELPAPDEVDDDREVDIPAAEGADDLELAERHPSALDGHRLRGEAEQHEPAAGADDRERLLLHLWLADGLDREIRAPRCDPL